MVSYTNVFVQESTIFELNDANSNGKVDNCTVKCPELYYE